MTSSERVSIKFCLEQRTFIEPEAWEVASTFKEIESEDLQISLRRAEAPPYDQNRLPMIGIEAVVASIALPSIAFLAKTLRDIIINYLKAKDNASVEIEMPDGRKVKITGPEATSDRVLEIIQRIGVHVDEKR